ncbi:putative FAD-binding oxidoreductase [Lophiostoma macrostomum CBS 122681]|uniref:Putative FAD-binding oxidoreductase n=1 Tax=Lophiostoma macrostomum CBS 122681 TaxID=1314788 RepID=A0A6A6SM08_9PLEO|nr:putative FAD-binding oxidoreductase [Lophiostoma macrostomum CBS 122681]
MRIFIQLYLIAALITPRVSSLLLDSGTEACQQLKQIYGASTSTPGDPDYENLRTHHWVQSAWAVPACIVQPSTLTHLQNIVMYLRKSNLTFAIRSGGHSPHHGWANIDNSVLIDLAAFNQFEYNVETNLTTVGAGMTWGEVYKRLEVYQSVVVGGRVLGVGVGGLTLGGGLSWLTQLYGLVCDNVVNFQVVLANGSTLNANAAQNPDLWWALKGGSNIFGIVTEVTLKTYPMGQVWGGVRTYSLTQFHNVVKAYYEFQSSPDKSPYANLIVLISPTNSTIGILVSMVYLKPEQGPKAFAAFDSLNASFDSTGIKNFTDYMAEYVVPDILRVDWHATSFAMNESLYSEIVEVVMSSPSLGTIKNTTAGFLAVVLQPVSASVARTGLEYQGNALGIPAVDQTWLAVVTGWWSKNDDARMHNAGDRIVDAISTTSQSRGKHIPYIFMNDASWDQDVLASYGGENVRRLKRVRRTYDPENVLQKLVPGGFKL